MVIKVQVFVGGCGKGIFDNGLKGGVCVIYFFIEVKMFVEQMIGYKFIIKQIGVQGCFCNFVYICECKFVCCEFYFVVFMDCGFQGFVIVFLLQGGMDIEGVVKENFDVINIIYIDINVGVMDEMVCDIVVKFGFSEQCVDDVVKIIQNFYKIFFEKDVIQIEINFFFEILDYKVMCMDVKFNFDDNVEFCQKEVFEWCDIIQEDVDEVCVVEFGFNFIKFDGDIGCFVNGVGFVMVIMDIIKFNGGQFVNFFDVGGGVIFVVIKEVFEFIISDFKVIVIFVNIFGGIVCCDVIVYGLINIVKLFDFKIFIIVCLQGINMEEVYCLINDLGMKIFFIDDLQNVVEKVVQFSKVVKMGMFFLFFEFVKILIDMLVLQFVILMLVLSLFLVFKVCIYFKYQVVFSLVFKGLI